MANELITKQTTGLTIYFIIIDSQKKIFNPTSGNFEALLTANWQNFINLLLEQDTTGIYISDFPSNIISGIYSLFIYKQLGGSPLSTDKILAVGTINWNGTKEIQFINSGDAYEPETGYNVRQIFSLLLSVLSGKSSGFLGSKAVTNAKFKAPDGTTDRITVTTDNNGNRTSITLSPPN